MQKLKYFILTFIILLATNPVFADVMPYYSGSISKNTIGFVQVPKSFNIYLYPREDSLILDTVKWNNQQVGLLKTVLEPREFFSVLKPSLGLAMCMVVDEQEDWYKIVYDKLNKKTGWIKAQNHEDFWGLRDFVSYYGKKHGLYYMKNIDYHKAGIYSGAYQESQKLGGFTMIKSIKLNKVSGNWALVTVMDFDSKPKIGYIRWREDNGTIIAFPKL